MTADTATYDIVDTGGTRDAATGGIVDTDGTEDTATGGLVDTMTGGRWPHVARWTLQQGARWTQVVP